ncbi:arginase [Ectobacillus sp. sgz5001026]|uniref:arginase n=1 Tax=Ectobacillus sp. sgz5001026 TaxID=3242473 RepID=UPI0036D40E9C
MDISIVGVPMDLGQTRRGVDMGPSAIRYAGIIERIEALGYKVKDLGDIAVDRLQHNDGVENPKLKNAEQVIAVCNELAKAVDEVINCARFPLILGGDHSIAIGSISGLAQHYNNLGVIWFDAHGDLNTDATTPSGNIHGMSLAASIGHGNKSLTHLYNKFPKVKKENVIIIGARSLDKGEKDFIREQGLKVYTMHEIDRMGMTYVMEETMMRLSKCDGVHLSLDLDGLDPHDAPGVGTPVTGGLTYRESHLAMEMLAESGIITSAEFVEVNPILDEKNKTAKAAVALIGSLLGEKLK